MDTSQLKIQLGSSTKLLFMLIFIILLLIILYIRGQLNKQNVCPPLLTAPRTTVGVYSTALAKMPITKLYIQTAYNCCCKGQFKDDYVDIAAGKENDFCALKNCALMGARALDFMVYSINGKPAISASTNSEINYKEMYNHIDFQTTMEYVYRYFLFDSNTSYTGDPLFLIFRIQSNLQSTYNSVASSIAQVFGTGNSFGNLIYNKRINYNTTLNDIRTQRVIIIVQPTDQKYLIKSTLNGMTAYPLNPDSNVIPCINRYSDNLNSLKDDPNIHFAFPNLDTVPSKNKDTTDLFNKNITFIGMNYQTGLKDVNLNKYVRTFGNSSFYKSNIA